MVRPRAEDFREVTDRRIGSNGLEAAARIVAEHPDTRVILLSMHANEEYVLQALRAGVAGYILKDSALAERSSRSGRCGGETRISLPPSPGTWAQTQKMEALGQLAAGVSHDFNNLLTAILGYAGLLAAKVGENAPLFEEIDEIRKAAESAASLSRQLLAFSRKKVFEPRRVNLNDSVREDVAVRPDPYVLLAVTDTGTGMDSQTRARVFEPFFTTKEAGKGTGLGLATVYGIVKQSGGYIWVYSDVGRGATFKVYLPCIEEKAEIAGTLRTPPPGLGGLETVLLAEDEPSMRALTRTILQSYGYTVLEACGADAALELARLHEGPIHVLLTNVVLPEMDGPELAARMRELRPEARVLYTSGYTDDTIVRRGLLVPGARFLQKPYTPAALAARLRETLDT